MTILPEHWKHFGQMPFTKKQRADRYIEKIMYLIFQTGYPIKTGEMIKF